MTGADGTSRHAPIFKGHDPASGLDVYRVDFITATALQATVYYSDQGEARAKSLAWSQNGIEPHAS